MLLHLPGRAPFLGFTSKLVSENIQRNFLQLLEREGIAGQLLEHDFPAPLQKKASPMAAGIRIFTFLCAASVILCWMLNLMLTPDFLWGGYVTAGVFCMWLLVIVGYRKRKNPLKNGMWQLLIVTLGAFLWDHFTGYKGWSLDFVLPFATITIQGAMLLIAGICRMEIEEYLFYLVQGLRGGPDPLDSLLCRRFGDSVSFPALRRDQRPAPSGNRFLPQEGAAKGDQEKVPDLKSGNDFRPDGNNSKKQRRRTADGPAERKAA